jgi:hypothetical protein
MGQGISIFPLPASECVSLYYDKILTVQLDPGVEIRSVELQGEWANSPIQIGT